MKWATHINIKGLYTGFLMLMVISLPFSTFGLSVAQFGLLGTWALEGILHGNFKRTLARILSNKPAQVLISFYLLHLLGLLYTTDLDFALKDIRIKLPLLFLPVIFVTSDKLRSQNIDLLLGAFIAGVLTATFISLGVLFTREINDFRELSPFISHIRLSLNVCLAFFFVLHMAFYAKKPGKTIRIILSVVAIWFLVFLVMIESITGLIIILTASFFLTLHYILRLPKLGAAVNFSHNSISDPCGFGFISQSCCTVIS
jgi:hypothetical protein